MLRAIVTALLCLSLAACAGGIVPVPLPAKAKTPCECRVDDVNITLPIPPHIWDEMTKELSMEELDEHPAEWVK